MTAKFNSCPALLEAYDHNSKQQWHSSILQQSGKHIDVELHSSSNHRLLTGIHQHHDLELKTHRKHHTFPVLKRKYQGLHPAGKTTTQDEQQLRQSTRPNALRCYSCCEPGNWQTAYPHATRRGLLLDETLDDQEVYDSQDEEGQADGNIVHPTTGDHERLLVLRRACLKPQQTDDKWLRTNIFRYTCTIKGHICSFVIDSGSFRNVISEEAVDKMGIKREKHPAPYNLGWLNDYANIRITQHAIIPFSIGLHYKDRMYCDIAPIDFCHLLLGRPWEFDRKIIHDGAANTYRFL